MSDESTRTGPVMLVCTSVLRRAPLRIGGLGERITFHRTVRVAVIAYGAVGVFVGFVAGALISIFVGGFNLIVYATATGGMLGVAAESWSPLRGESILRWLGLMVTTSARRQVEMEGASRRVYIGLCALNRVAAGPVHLRGAAVEAERPALGRRGRPSREPLRTPSADGFDLSQPTGRRVHMPSDGRAA